MFITNLLSLFGGRNIKHVKGKDDELDPSEGKVISHETNLILLFLVRTLERSCHVFVYCLLALFLFVVTITENNQVLAVNFYEYKYGLYQSMISSPFMHSMSSLVD